MKRGFWIVLGLFLLLPVIQGQEKAGRTLKVSIHYTGNGTVDEKHKIFAVLFDSPAFATGEARPIAVRSASSKDEVVTFSDVSKSPVYAAASYDPTGNYDGESGPPPAGASLGMYSKTRGTPEPIQLEPGKTVQVELTFDDRVKMQ